MREFSVATFPDPLYAQNARVVHLGGQKLCWLIDPGFAPSAGEILNHLDSNGLDPAAVVLTHAHADHIAGIPEILAAHRGLPFYLARVEWSFLSDPSENLSAMGGMPLTVEVPELRDLAESDVLELSGSCWRCLDTSGHSPGGRTLYCESLGVAIVGDALFAGSIGRTDFPHSDGASLIANIKEKLLTLPDDTKVLSGHGPDTTIGAERRTNPFL